MIFFPGLSSLGRLPAAKDTLTFSFPAQAELGRALHHGYFPVWSTHLNSPLFAEGQGGFAHPLALALFAALPPVAASDLYLLIHLYAGLAFTYLLCRELGQSRAAAAFAAPAFGLGAYFLTRLGIYTIVTNGVWLPGLLWLAHRYGRTADLRYALAGAAGGALAILAGQFQLASYAVVAAALCAAVKARGWKSRLAGALAFGALPLALAAVQLAPTFELWRLSERAADTRAGEYSFWPPQFVQLLLPDLFGRTPHPAFAPVVPPLEDGYWGRSSFVESGFYVGVLPFVLAIAGVARKRRWFFLAAGVVAAVFALGTYTPLFSIYKFIPPFGLFRAPARLLIFPALALAVAAGDGLESLFERRRAPFVAAVLCLLAAAAVFFGFRASLPTLKTLMERTAAAKAAEVSAVRGEAASTRALYGEKAAAAFARANRAAAVGNARTWVQLGMLAAGVGLGALAWRSRAGARVAPYAVIILAALDLYHYGRGLNPTIKGETVTRPPPVAAAWAPAPAGRIFSSGYDVDGRPTLGLGLVHANTHAIWGYELPVARASLRPAYGAAAFDKLEALYTTAPDAGGRRRVRADAPPMGIFAAYGVKYFVRLEPWRGDGASLLAGAGPYYVYANDLAAPPARAVTRYDVVAGDAAALAAMAGPDYAPERGVILHGEPPSFTANGDAPPVVTLERPSPSEAVCRTRGAAPAIVVLADLYYPGWRATVDGKPAPILRADVMSRAVAVPAGEHVIRFAYRPRWFYAGLAASACAWLGVALAFAALTVRRSRRHA